MRFRLATEADDTALRQLLQCNPMRGRITLSLERSPNYFHASAIEGRDHRTIVAIDGSGRIVCCGEVSYRQRFINGQPQCVGYLGALRLDASVCSRHSVIRQGYQFFQQTADAHESGLHFTSIAADNARARRFLEARLPGMPIYRPIDGYTTHVLPARRIGRRTDSDVRQARAEDLPLLGKFLRTYGARRQLFPVWQDADLCDPILCRGLGMQDFVLLFDARTLIATAAVWDQRAFKQAVIRHYARPLAVARPVLNRTTWLTGAPRLPPVGSALHHAYVSHFACTGDEAECLSRLLPSLGRNAAARGADSIIVGCADSNPAAPAIAKICGGRRYESVLYRVELGNENEPALTLDSRTAAPEVALL